ncbi:thioredoxin family protein [Patescibacteria group bacterium AH-259-L05]|nr:thioredoxin family protein [Patescibacteria group bacterium AH-259-L05]
MTENKDTNQITLEELSAPGCHVCKQFEEFWYSIEKDWPNVKYKNIDVTTPEGQELAQKHMIFASPGIIINGELWATGGFDRKKFVQKLKQLS